jgi:hypothetical protein
MFLNFLYLIKIYDNPDSRFCDYYRLESSL